MFRGAEGLACPWRERVTSLTLITDSANSYQGPTPILDDGVTARDNTEKILALGACILAGEKQKQIINIISISNCMLEGEWALERK